MDLNAYAMATAIASAPSQRKNRRTFPEKRVQAVRSPQGLACEQHSTTIISRQGEAQNNLSQTLTNS